MSAKIYEVVTDRIIDILEKGVIPWRKPWSASQVLAKNMVSGKEYRGCNFMLTNCQGYESPFWGTYKQIEARGGQVKKGSKGTPIIFWSLLKYKDKEKEGKEKSVPLLKMSFVFNADQCDGLDFGKPEGVIREHTPIEECERILGNVPLGFSEVRHCEARAFYNPRLDYINMPRVELFKTSEEYYHTRFHESVHATGHKDRLGREGVEGVSHFGDSVYSFEELVAELGASYLSAKAGIGSVVVENSAAYINGWLSVLRKDSKFLVKASGAAQKACKYILNEKEVESGDGESESGETENKVNEGVSE